MPIGTKWRSTTSFAVLGSFDCPTDLKSDAERMASFQAPPYAEASNPGVESPTPHEEVDHVGADALGCADAI